MCIYQAFLPTLAIFASTAKMKSFRTLVAIAAAEGKDDTHMDVCTAFLNAPCEEDIYMRQPPGAACTKHPHYVWKLLKCIYGLKNAPQNWADTLHRALSRYGFIRLESDQAVYLLRSGSKICAISAHVDDLCIVSNDKLLMQRTKPCSTNL